MRLDIYVWEYWHLHLVCVTVLLYRMKRAEEHRQEKKQYEKSAEQAKKDEE